MTSFHSEEKKKKENHEGLSCSSRAGSLRSSPTEDSSDSSQSSLRPRRHVDWYDKIDHGMVGCDLKELPVAENLEWKAKLEAAVAAERNDANQRLEQARREWMEQTDANENDLLKNLLKKYRDATEKREELLVRLHRMDEQQSEGKRQMEGSLVKFRRAMKKNRDVAEQLEQERKHHGQEMEALHQTLKKEVMKRETVEEKHSKEVEELTSQLQASEGIIRVLTERTNEMEKCLQDASQSEEKETYTEIDAVNGTGDVVHVLTDEPVSPMDQNQPRFLQFQKKLFSETEESHESDTRNTEGEWCSNVHTKCDFDIAAQLQIKQSCLANCCVELKILRRHLSAEVSKREEAEAVVEFLNDQGDTYSEDLMHLQAENARLDVALTEAECKMSEVLAGRTYEYEDESLMAGIMPCDSSTSKAVIDSSSSPLLEEALAIAQGLTHILHHEEGKEISIIEILENFSQMMEQHDRNNYQDQLEEQKSRDGYPGIDTIGEEGSDQVAKTHSGTGNDGSHGTSPNSCHNGPPEHDPTPLRHDWALSTEPALYFSAEQVYARCRLLERERLEMMQVSLEAREATRRACKAEVAAAVATARREASEELTRLRKQNHVDREALYRMLCSRCAKCLSI
jgi:hypothetical protein